MKKELQQQLYEKYPYLFGQRTLTPQETCMCWGIACGDGWYSIIDTLCSLIKHKVQEPLETIERYENYIKRELLGPKLNIDYDKINTYREVIQITRPKIIDPIQFVQIKEKYGTLRVYTNYYDETIGNYIEFAESISEITCEVCGSPGTINNQGWLKVRCPEHKQ